MGKFKTYDEFLSEDGAFASVGAAPGGNVSGMGDVAAPTSTTTGSGDAWPSLFKPFSLVPLEKRKRRKKKKKRS